MNRRLAIASAVERRVAGRRVERLVRRRLRDGDGAGCEPATGQKAYERGAGEVLAIGRIEES